MDPDMVRQQEEAEAASRIPQPPAKPQALFSAPAAAATVTYMPGARSVPPAGAANPARKAKAGKGGVWFVALLDTALTVIGLSQGLKTGEDLVLVPWQALAAGALGGFLLGWGATAVWLRLRYGFSRSRAAGVAIVPTAIILLIMMAAMKLALQFNALFPPALAEAMEDYHAGVFIVGCGVVLAGFLALMRFWKVLRA